MLFGKLVGEENCLHLDGPDSFQVEHKTLGTLTALCERNGKPCCLNLITDGDNKFLANLKKEEERKIKEAQAAVEQAVEETGSKDEGEEAEEGEKTKEVVESEEEDEVAALIKREEQEAHTREREAEEKKRVEEEESEIRKVRETKEATRLEQIRQTERDLLDQRSQPIRQYLMDNVVPHLTEGLIQLCKEVPEDSTEFLANFLFERADLLDEQVLKERDEMIRKRQEEKKANARKGTR